MREIKIRKFSRNLKEELLDLPVMITRYGKPIAVVLDPDRVIDRTSGQIPGPVVGEGVPLTIEGSVGKDGIISFKEGAYSA